MINYYSILCKDCLAIAFNVEANEVKTWAKGKSLKFRGNVKLKANIQSWLTLLYIRLSIKEIVLRSN